MTRQRLSRQRMESERNPLAARPRWPSPISSPVAHSIAGSLGALTPRFSRELTRWSAIPLDIRYHGFQGTVRASAAAAVAHHGIRLTDLTSSWAPFVVHATSFLKPNGRLAFVLPGELLYVDYAKAVRDFLSVAYKAVSIIAFDERVFPGVLADTLLVLAEKQGPSEGLSVTSSSQPFRPPHQGCDLWRERPHSLRYQRPQVVVPDSTPGCESGLPRPPRSKRSPAPPCLLHGRYWRCVGEQRLLPANSNQLDRSRIPPSEVVPCLSSSRHLLGTRIGKEEFAEVRRAGQKAWLLNLAGKSRLSEAAKGYLAKGTHNGAREGYKVHSRRKWYSVPSVYSPDAFMSYFISEAPRFTVNDVGATSTNTIHRMRRVATNGFDTEMLVLSCYSTVTGLSAEVEGRSYGGGVARARNEGGGKPLRCGPERRLSQGTPTVPEGNSRVATRTRSGWGCRACRSNPSRRPASSHTRGNPNPERRFGRTSLASDTRECAPEPRETIKAGVTAWRECGAPVRNQVVYSLRR